MKPPNGYASPESIGDSFACCNACMAANAPVGKISASRSRELGDSSAFGDSAFISDTRKRVPPAFGTRTYCACPPGRVGMPNRVEWMQRHVKPTLQKLCTQVTFGIREGIRRVDLLTFAARDSKGRNNFVPDE